MGKTVQRNGPVTYAEVVAEALRLPGTEVGTSYNTPSLKVKGKLMARLRAEAEGALALRCEFLDRAMLMQADPLAFFFTDHYRDYPMVLIRLEHLRREALAGLVERAWRMVARPKLVKAFDAQQSASSFGSAAGAGAAAVREAPAQHKSRSPEMPAATARKATSKPRLKKS